MRVAQSTIVPGSVTGRPLRVEPAVNTSIVELTEERGHLSAEAPELFAVNHRECGQSPISVVSEEQQGAAVVGWVGLAGHESVGFGAADELPGRVQSELQDVGDLCQRGWLAARIVAPDSEEELMLGRGESSGACFLLGEALEEPERVPEACECLVVAVGERWSGYDV